MPQTTQGVLITAAAQISDGVVTSAAILDGTIANVDVSAAAAIDDTKLATIATASKVSGNALALLANIPSGAGVIPVANIPAAASHMEELADVNLGAANNELLSGTISARPFLLILIDIPSLSASSAPQIQFNADTATNYSNRFSEDGAAETTATSAAQIQVKSANAPGLFITIQCVNRAANQKGCVFQVTERRAITVAPTRSEGVGCWGNTADQITSVRLFMSASATMGAGTRMIILGPQA